WPRCTCQGCSPPGTALETSTCARVCPWFLGSPAIHPVPCICSTPANSGGVESVPFQRTPTDCASGLISTGLLPPQETSRRPTTGRPARRNLICSSGGEGFRERGQLYASDVRYSP